MILLELPDVEWGAGGAMSARSNAASASSITNRSMLDAMETLIQMKGLLVMIGVDVLVDWNRAVAVQ